MDKLSQSGARRPDTLEDQQPIKTGAFGGLNTVTPLLNLPYSDSPSLLNTVSGVSGSMSKRLGTKVTYSEDGLVGGFSSATLRTSLNHHYVIAKQGTSLRVYETVDAVTSLVLTKTNVWNSSAQNSRATTAVTNEPLPRVIFCTGTNAPVQLSVVENATITTSTGTSFTVSDPNGLYKWATASNLLIYRNGTRITTPTVSWVANVLTVSGLSSQPAGTQYDTVLMTWQWIGEGFRYLGQDLYYPTTKFHIDLTDQNISIPEDLRDNIFTINSNRVYPFYVYKNTVWGNSYTLSGTYTPTTIDEFHFSSGAVHTPGNVIRPAPNYVTFGAIRPPISAPEEVHIFRGRLLPFNGGLGATGSNIRVYLNGTQLTQSTSIVGATAASYYLRDNTGAIITSTSTVGHHITFDSSGPMGLLYTDEIVILNTELTDIGSGATVNIDKYRDGSIQPLLGIGYFSVYGKGFHPSVICTYQGRLVFSGWRHDPLRLVASEVWDALVANNNFLNFDIPQSTGLATDPIDFQVTSYADDYVVNLYELHNSLFVFTRNAVYGIKPTQGALSVTAVEVSKVANIGLVNPRAVDVIENTIFFLSDSGVYDLTPTIETGDYFTGERSLKIRNLVNRQLSEANKDTAFITYNKLTSEVYLGLPTKSDTSTASRLLVYSLLRDSWFQYQTPAGFNLWGATPILDLTRGTGFLLWTTTKFSGVSPNNLIALLTDNTDYYLDFLTTTTGTGTSQNIPLPPDRGTTITTTNSQHEYKPSFEITPFPEVADLVVTLNGSKLTFGVDWTKRTNGTIYLLANPGSGKTLIMRPRRPINDDEVGLLNYGTGDYKCPVVIVNNVTKREGTDYTVESDGSITLTAPSGSSIKVGSAYLTMYSTPLFTQGVLGRFKRLFHFFGYFNNAEGLENFTGADVVGSQNPDEIVDRPKKELGVNVAVAYDSGYSSELTYDLYQFASLVWDFSFFDTSAPIQDKPYILFKEPILGVSYGFQVWFYNWDEKYFDLVGYQVDGKLKGRYSVR